MPRNITQKSDGYTVAIWRMLCAEVVSSAAGEHVTMPTTLGALAAATTIKTGIEQAWKWRRGKSLAEQDRQEEMNNAYELAVRLAGGVLFELRDSVERIRLMAQEHQDKAGVTYGTFDFTVSEATMPRLCESLPTPVVVHEFHAILAAIRRVDFYQRIGGGSEMVMTHCGVLGDQMVEDQRGFGRAIGFATDALNKGLVERFNRLRDLIAGVGQAALPEAWGAVEGSFVPARIDASSKADHALL